MICMLRMWCIGNGQNHQSHLQSKVGALNCMHDQQAIIVIGGGGTQMDTVVRRLTPTECERLQGYPDGWCDIGDWIDEKGKTRKTTDSAKYKALGNSIALPFWFWLLRRISAEYETPATMGSLFSGIGGFDLAWSRCNGSGSVLWSSEIESYPIAVMRKHFGDEDLGIEGDIRKYL